MKVVMVNYPLDAPIDQLFPPSQSNSAQYKASTKSLVRKLQKKGLLSEFHDQMVKSVMLTREEGEDVETESLFQWDKLR